jgi:diguanylate cyclase (GGDEF)-like protein
VNDHSAERAPSLPRSSVELLLQPPEKVEKGVNSSWRPARSTVDSHLYSPDENGRNYTGYRSIVTASTSQKNLNSEVVVPETLSVPSARSTGMAGLLREIWEGFTRKDSWTPAAVIRLAWVLPVATFFSWLGIVLSHQSEGVATIWFSNGLIFSLLITQPKRRWLPYFLVGLTADTLADMIYGDVFQLAFGVSLANSVEVVTSTLLLTRWFGYPLDLRRRRSLIGFLLIAVVGATALTSALGAFWTIQMEPGPSWWQMFRTWYLGDLLGMAIVAPLIIMVQQPGFFDMFSLRELPHTFLVLVAPVVVTTFVFTHSTDPLIFLIFPAFLLVAFRLGLPGTVVNILLVTLVAIGFTIKGHGPLMLIAGQHMLLHRVVIAQVFAAVAIFTMFPVAAILEEKEALKRSLATSEARFRNLALKDELTGLPNRRAFNLQFEHAWEQAFTRRRCLGLMILDVDQFKQYNDVAGHPAGDAHLQSIARVVDKIAETTHAIPARIGGEEFAMILPDTTLERMREIAEAVRESVLDLALPHPTTASGMQTVSLGVAVRVPTYGETSTELMRVADKAMYEAKLNGRNQVAWG